MALPVARITPALLALVVAMLAIAAAQGETPTTSAASDCLAKPNEPAAKGNHWYYRVEHPSGRHCWYQRPIDAAQDAQPQAPAAKAAPSSQPRAATRAIRPKADTAGETGPDTADDGASIVPPIAAPLAPPTAAPAAPPFGLFGAGVIPPAPPAAAPTAPEPAQSVDIASPPPTVASAIAPKADTNAPTPQLRADAAVPNGIPMRAPPAKRRDTLVESDDSDSHVPALLGAVAALAIIILGSIAGQSIGNRRHRREQIVARDRQHAVAGMPESPGIVPLMADRRDVARDMFPSHPSPQSSPDDWGLRRGWAPQRTAPPAAPIRETTRMLEDNVRELLRRLQSELRGDPASLPRAATAPATGHGPTTQELDAVLAIWRAKRRG